MMQVKAIRLGISYIQCLLLCVYSHSNVYASDIVSASSWIHRVDVSAYYGFIWAHCPAITHLQEKNLPLIQLSFSHQTEGNKEWHHRYSFPNLGVGILYGNLGRPEVTGHAFSVAPHISLPLYRGNIFDLFIRHNLGLAYLTKKHDPLLNAENNAIGSHVNIFYSSTINMQLKTRQHGKLSGGLGLIHFSNGSVRKPNLGINVPVIMLTYTRRIVPVNKIPEPKSRTDNTRNTSLLFSLAGGVSRVSPYEDQLFPAYSLAATISRKISTKRNIGLGADLFLNYADKQIMLIKEPKHSTINELLKPGIHLSYEQAFGKVDFIIHNGIYLAEKHRKKEALYTRIGFRYQTHNKLLIHFCLNSNRFTASFIELGVGMRMFAFRQQVHVNEHIIHY